ncbi:hypothetical protein [Parvularcula sp. LCG005]|uniref:hypothetical protein n=1 Tax=Parvularcula sp. LCG005 TaxID=3078805 RepID=UPI002943326C|nr:hypothetical protein [Parvularcula sp. LCG005]WOI52721.1 hypothetical protein RUI03_11245 [Parvularcula sp. LCG005]
MKSNVPWSVKGIDPEARVVAKEAAKKAGMTLGEWMTSMINEVGPEGVPTEKTADTTDSPPKTGVAPEQLRAVVDSLNRLNERLKATEENLKKTEDKSRQAVGGLNHGLETVFERLKRIEKAREAGTSPDIVDRVEKLETSDADRERIESLRALERALTQMIDQFESTRNEAISRVAKNEEAVARLDARVDDIDTRMAAQFQEVHDAMETVGQQLDQTERTAKAVMLEAREAANSTDEEFVERTGKKLQLLGNEIKRSGDQIAAVEQMVSSLSNKIEDAERRSAEGIAEIAVDLTSLRDEFAQGQEAASASEDLRRATADAEETVATLQRSYDEMLARLEGRSLPADEADGSEDDDAGEAEAPAAAALAAAPEQVSSPADDFNEAGGEDEFDAVFGGAGASGAPTTVEDEPDDAPAHAAAIAIGEAEPAATTEETPADDTPKPLTAREKILAAAKARKERLERENAAEQQADAPDEGMPAEIIAEDTPFTATDEPTVHTEDDETDTAQNRKLGLPLVALLAVLLAAMIGGAVIFFGASQQETTSTEQTSTSDPANEPAPVAAKSPRTESESTSSRATVNEGGIDGSALYARGKMLLNNATSDSDRSEAFAAFQEAAFAGYVPAQYRLGDMYFNGLGTSQNLPAAKKWFTDAALSGNAAAMHRLGTLAINEDFEGEDIDLAIEWFSRAADYGVIDSMYNLGYLYDPSVNRLPVDMRDAAKSYRWYMLASRQGDPQAPIDGANVAVNLDQAVLDRIDAEVANWRPVPFDPAVNDGLQLVE